MERVREVQAIQQMRGVRANRVPFTLAIAAVLIGCVSFPAPTPDKAPVSLENVESEISESQLLDVQIAIFDPGELPSRESRARGLSEDVRKAEAVFIPTHLRNTLQRTGHWGAVRVVPAHTSSAELLLSGRILDSNGETLELEIEVRDATGTEWFKKTFESNVALGASIGRLSAKDEDTFNGTVTNEDKVTGTLYGFRVGLGGDHFFDRHFSIGVEGGFQANLATGIEEEGATSSIGVAANGTYGALRVTVVLAGSD